MRLHEITQKRYELQKKQSSYRKSYEQEMEAMTKEAKELERLEKIAMNDLNLNYVQLAESVMYVKGDPYAATDNVKKGSASIAAYAITDIATGCLHLKKEFYGNKTYSGYYQQCDCEYGYGPNHGGIKDEIGLKQDARKRELTDDEKDACIYYLRNYKKIKELTVS